MLNLKLERTSEVAHHFGGTMYTARFIPEFYSCVCRATVPERWIAEDENGQIVAQGDTADEALRLANNPFGFDAGRAADKNPA